MRIGIIDVGWVELYEDSLTDQALGGSETWLLSITKELTDKGHHVDVYCNTSHEWTKNGNFIPLYDIVNKFQSLCSNRQRYDFIILNRVIRRFNTDYITLIRQYNITERVFIQLHDLSPIYEDHPLTPQEIDQTGIFDKRVHGIVFLTNWQKHNFELQYPVLNSIPKYVIPNGVNLEDFPKKRVTQRRILWSSCTERGLDILLDMYDDIKSQVPDFGIDIAGYNDLSKINIQDKDVQVLGNLNKSQLYQEMSKHRVWFYPGTFAETFCITMIENMMCGNIVVSPFTYGTADVVTQQYKSILHEYYGKIERFDKNYTVAKQEAVNAIVKVLNNYDDSIAELGKKIASTYTWTNTVDKYIKLYNVTYYRNITPRSMYYGVFLSQSSNIDFFEQESEVVEQTWAKPIIEGKYPGYLYFRYTACDSKHPEPCIIGNTIYVLNDDSLIHTYEKMREAYRLLLLYGYDFVYLFRTNTSTYINVPKVIKEFRTLDDNTVKAELGGYYRLLPSGGKQFLFNCFTGNAYMMKKSLADRVFLSRYDSSILDIPSGDDIITGCILNELADPGEIIYKPLNIVNNRVSNCYQYKCLPSSEVDPEYVDRHTDNSEVVHDSICVSVRVKSNDYGTRIACGEFDHMKELHEEYKKRN